MKTQPKIVVRRDMTPDYEKVIQQDTARTETKQGSEWQNIGKSNNGYFLWKSADEQGKPIYKYERTQPNPTEGGYYSAESAAKIKNLESMEASIYSQMRPARTETGKAQWERPDNWHPRESTTGRQAAHSPLPWSTGQSIDVLYDANSISIAESLSMSDDMADANFKLIVASVNHADKLAETLRGVIWKCDAHGSWKPTQAEREAMHEALAAYGQSKGARQ